MVYTQDVKKITLFAVNQSVSKRTEIRLSEETCECLPLYFSQSYLKISFETAGL